MLDLVRFSTRLSELQDLYGVNFLFPILGRVYKGMDILSVEDEENVYKVPINMKNIIFFN